MKIPEILRTDNIFEAPEANDRKTIRPAKTVKTIESSRGMIKPIGPKPPTTPEELRIQSRKNDVKRAKENLKKERINQMQSDMKSAQ